MWIAEDRIIVEVVGVIVAVAAASCASRQRQDRVAEVDAQHVVGAVAELHSLASGLPHVLHIAKDDVDVGSVGLFPKRRVLNVCFPAVRYLLAQVQVVFGLGSLRDPFEDDVRKLRLVEQHPVDLAVGFE